MKVGAYYYTYARTEEAVISEVSAFLAVLEGLQLEYPVFVDVEDNSLKTLPRAELTRLVKFAMDILDQKGLAARVLHHKLCKHKPGHGRAGGLPVLGGGLPRIRGIPGQL